MIRARLIFVTRRIAVRCCSYALGLFDEINYCLGDGDHDLFARGSYYHRWVPGSIAVNCLQDDRFGGTRVAASKEPKLLVSKRKRFIVLIVRGINEKVSYIVL